LSQAIQGGVEAFCMASKLPTSPVRG
jgi:hypothetical protein